MFRDGIIYSVFLFLSLPLVYALNTHDVSGLGSDLWTKSADKLPGGKWAFQLETYDGFPFEFDKSSASICFETKEDQVAIFNYEIESPLRPSATPSCCFVVDKKNISQYASLIKVNRIIMSPSKNKSDRSAIHFDVREPAGIFKSFYCSSIIDDYDAISMRKTHMPSLADMSNLLNVGFRLNPDPI